jgi:hypothetical protein
MKEKMDRLTALMEEKQIAVISCDSGEHILAELWVNQDGTIQIHPFAKYLSEEEKRELKLLGETPERHKEN